MLQSKLWQVLFPPWLLRNLPLSRGESTSAIDGRIEPQSGAVGLQGGLLPRSLVGAELLGASVLVLSKKTRWDRNAALWQGVLAHDRGLAGSVSKVPMAVPMVLRYKELFPSRSTFETPPKGTLVTPMPSSGRMRSVSTKPCSPTTEWTSRLSLRRILWQVKPMMASLLRSVAYLGKLHGVSCVFSTL